MEFISLEVIFLLFIIAIVAGFIDTLAGGGGLITIPALMLSGIPTIAALATNKLQCSVGTATATYVLVKKRQVDWLVIRKLMPYAFIGSGVGTLIIHYINPNVLSFLIPLVLTVIAIYFLFSKSSDSSERRISPIMYKSLVVPCIGCYDGALGPGTGSFFSAAGNSLMGYSLIQATAQAKPLNFSSNIASLTVFLFGGEIVWAVGGVMMIGQIIGASLGSRCLMSINQAVLRSLVVLMCSTMLIKFLISE